MAETPGLEGFEATGFVGLLAPAVVRVHEYPDGRLAVFHGPHRLAEYDAEGRPHDDAKLAA
jgi:hypothetical protein